MRESKPQFQAISINPNSRIAIIAAKWNSEYNLQMQESAIEALTQAGLKSSNIDAYSAPGAFEIPVLAMKLARSKKYSAIICFATIIKGDTYHFELVANDSSRGIMNVSLETGVPVLNGILACNTAEQARKRASRDEEDKGREIALSALEIIQELEKIT
jgi:6,7-dimethyl-8-ribityllumazine synthase